MNLLTQWDVKAQEQRKSAARKSRQRIPRSAWPALIKSYDVTFDKVQWLKTMVSNRQTHLGLSKIGKIL